MFISLRKKTIDILKRKFIKETVWSFLTKGITFVLFYLFNIYLARILGVERFGKWSFFFSSLTIFQVLSYFGLNGSSRKFIAQFNYTDKISPILSSAAQLRLATSLLFSLFLVLFSGNIAGIFSGKISQALVLASVPFLFFFGVVEFLKHVFMGLQRIKFNFIINILEYGLKLFFLVGGVYWYKNLEIQKILDIHVCALVITSIAGFVIIMRKYLVWKDIWIFRKQFVRNIIKYSYPLFFISIGFVVITEINNVMLGFYHPDAEVGVYAVAGQIVNKLPQIGLAVVMGSMPVFAKLNKMNKDDLEKLLYKLLKVNGLIYGMIITVIFLFADEFIPFIFGEEYIDSVIPLKLLTPFLAVFAFNTILNAFLDYQGLAGKRACYLLMSAGLNIILNFVLIPRYGAEGAAVSNSISYIPYLILSWLEVQNRLKSVSSEQPSNPV